MKHSTERILTTHCGSLPRPKDLLDLMKARAGGEAVDLDAYAARVRGAVADIVRQQVQSGVDVVTDGEQSKTSFSAYVNERLTGFEPKADTRRTNFVAEMEAFPEYYEQYFGQRMQGGRVVPVAPVICTGPISYRGEEALRRDIENLKAAVAGVQPAEVFMPAVAPDGVGTNAYYPTEEEYLAAVADALHTEYQAIVDAGFLVQIDDPRLVTYYMMHPELSVADCRKWAAARVEAINESLRGIPPEKVRFHTCYSIDVGPRIHEMDLKDIVDIMLKIDAGAYSFEAANPRHEHEYHVFERIKLPEGKILIPGIISHTTNLVEHPELVAERILRFAKLVGRESVIAGADCGFAASALRFNDTHPSVAWLKFAALAEGSRLATRELWK